MKLYRFISITALLLIVIFVNFNNESQYIWWLIYYLQQYFIVFGFIYIGFMLEKTLLTRSVLFTLGFYYSFELSMDIVRIYNDALWDKIYSEKTINYVLCIGCALSLLILPLHNLYKKWNL